MPKKTARRIIDTRKDTGATIISGVTLSGGSTGGAATAAMAGDGLTYNSGVLDVGAGTLLTVAADSVGITAGSTYQFVGTGSGTAAAWQNMSGLAGAGLTHSAGVLAVGAGNGLTVNADDVALTTPGTLTVSTSNSASGSHTHAITSSSNPGANARLLASTASGGLTLQSLAVQGSVDVTNGGDLTVAGSGSYAGSSVLFVDSSGGNVGIMGAPDPQFALDIVGPCRATWFVGPHAIQLKNALMICQYDGKEPFNTNFRGELNGHMGQVGTVTGGAYFVAGKFGKALSMGPAATNLCTNPSFETGLAGWTYVDTNASGTAAQTALYDPPFGTYAVRLSNTETGGNDYIYHEISGLTANATYSVSAYCRVISFSGAAISNRGLVAYDTADVGTLLSTTITATNDGWERHTVTITTSASPGNLQVRLYAPNGYVLWDAVQIERSNYPTPYLDGSMGGYSSAGVPWDGAGSTTSHGTYWTGTAHASTSTRVAPTLLYGTNVIPTYKGTVMAWVWVSGNIGNQEIIRVNGTSAGYIILRYASGALSGYWGTASVSGGAIPLRTWTHVAMTYSAETLTIYVDGEAVNSGTSSGFSGMPTTFAVGYAPGGTQHLNGYIDSLAITAEAIAADGIRAVYESDAPVFAESARFSFRATPQGLVWADDEGLWMRNAAGSAVFGAYGGASTKSWAGLTLSPSDIVMGDSSRGSYAWWDDSAGAFAIGRSGTDRVKLTSAGVLSINDSGGNAVFTFDASAGAEFTKPLTMATTGGIYQGSGTFASPTTGLKIWNDSGVGRIGGYNGGDLQWTADTTGKLYAGYMSTSSTTNKYALRLARDGLRLTAEATGSYTVSTSASAIRWIYNSTGDVDGTIGSGETYTALYSYNNTTSNSIYTGLMTFVGDAVYATKDSVVYLTAQHWTGSVTKSVDFLLTTYKSTGNTLAYCNADRFYLTKALQFDEMTAPSAPAANAVYIYAEDNGSGKTRLMALFSSGAAKQIAIQP